MKKIIFIFICLTFSSVSPPDLNATLWNYSTGGSLENSDDHERFTVSGNMIIDDTLRLWNGNPTNYVGPPAPPDLENAQFSYLIKEYTLKINDYSFSGASGDFYLERTDNNMGDLMWFLSEGSGNWNEWTGEDFCFYHEDMTAYDLLYEYDELAPIIRLTSLDYRFNDPILSDWVITDIVLTRTSPAPVPEPATMLLLGTGLAGLLGLGKRKFRAGIDKESNRFR